MDRSARAQIGFHREWIGPSCREIWLHREWNAETRAGPALQLEWNRFPRPGKRIPREWIVKPELDQPLHRKWISKPRPPQPIHFQWKPKTALVTPGAPLPCETFSGPQADRKKLFGIPHWSRLGPRYPARLFPARRRTEKSSSVAPRLLGQELVSELAFQGRVWAGSEPGVVRFGGVAAVFLR